MKKYFGWRKFFALSAVILALCMWGAERVHGADNSVGAPEVIIEGESVIFDVLPRIQENRVLVPLRGIFERLGAQVIWDQQMGTVTILSDGKKIELGINSINAKINGAIWALDIAPFVINGRTMVPLRFVSENLGAKVEWVPASRQVKITSHKGAVIGETGVMPGNPESGQNKSNQQNTGKTGKGSGNNSRTGNNDGNGQPPGADDEPDADDSNQENPEEEPEVEEPEPQIDTTVTLECDTPIVKVGDTFQVKVYVEDVKDLYSTYVKLTYNPSLLKAKDIKGSFLGDSFSFRDAETPGELSHYLTKTGKVPGKTGDGVISIFVFEALKAGTGEISFTKERVKMINAELKLIDFTIENDSIVIEIIN
jgi:hypothetical protein